MSAKGGFMKNKSLFFQIGVTFAGIIIGLSIILALLFPLLLREFFTNEVYSTIEGAQHNIINKRLLKNLELEYSNEEVKSNELDIRSVTHIQVPREGINEVVKLKVAKAINSSEVSLGFFKQTIKQEKSQSEISKRYVSKIGEKKYSMLSLNMITRTNQDSYYLICGILIEILYLKPYYKSFLL